jgi:hypothetical protein
MEARMSAILAAFLQWATYSTWWKKYGGQAGAFCAGILASELAGDQIHGVFAALGVSSEAMRDALLAVVAAGGVGMSQWLSMRKTKLEAAKADPATPPAP